MEHRGRPDEAEEYVRSPMIGRIIEPPTDPVAEPEAPSSVEPGTDASAHGRSAETEEGGSAVSSDAAAGFRVFGAVERWQQELLDLSRSNRLLYFAASTGQSIRGAVRIGEPTPAELFDRLANRERRQTIARPPVPPDPTANHEDQPELLPLTPAPRRLGKDEVRLDVEPARHDALLYRLRLRARSALLEQGIDVLYVAFGLLEWPGVPREANGQRATPTPTTTERALSPLLLLPVRIDRERSIDPYTLTPLDEHPILNPALLFQLESAYKLELALPVSEDGDLEYAAVLAGLRAQLSTQTDWTVQDGAFLGLFSFAKQAMYADLAANRDLLAEHPVVRALAGVPGAVTSSTLPDPARLDDEERPRETFQVLDADASQRTVLAAIRRGDNLVVQGPPGTGKSQTIANAIAEALSRRKSVLFVSEKLAALQVVAKRLREAGLGEFCLEAHGHGGDKATIVKGLAAALPEDAYRPTPPRTDDLLLLAERRAALNGYARALHDANNPLRASAFAIHGELARRAGAPRVQFELASVGELTQERVFRLTDLVRRLVPLAQVVTAPEQHPWSGCTLDRWSPLAQAQIETTLERLAAAADELAELQGEVTRRWRLPPQPTLEGARTLHRIVALLDSRPPARTDWLRRPSTADLTEQAMSWSRRCAAYRQQRLTILSHYHERVFELDLQAISSGLERVSSGALNRIRGEGSPGDRALGARAGIQGTVNHLREAVPQALAAAEHLAAPLRLPTPTTRAELTRLLQTADLIRANPRPEPGWLEPGRLGLLADLATEAACQTARAAEATAILSARFEPSVLGAITPELATRFEATYATAWIRWLRPGWYTDIGVLRRHLRTDAPRTPDAPAVLEYEEAIRLIRAWRELTAAEDWFEAQALNLATAFGRHYQGGRTDWTGIQGSLETVRQLTDLLGDLSQRQDVAQLLLDPNGPATLDRPTGLLRAALAELDAALAGLAEVTTDSPATSSRAPRVDPDVSAPTRQPEAGSRWRGAETRSPSAAPVGNWGAPAEMPLAELVRDLERWIAVLMPLWTASEALQRARRHRSTSLSELQTEARAALALRAFEAEFAVAMPRLAADLGGHFRGLATDWPAVQQALTWAERLRACFDASPPESFLAILDAEPPGAAPERATLEQAIQRVEERLLELRASFANGGPMIGTWPADRATLPALAAWARSRHTALPRLREWIDARALLAELHAVGLAGLVQALVREAPPPSLWVDAFLRQLFTLWLTWRHERSPALAKFRRYEHEDTVAEFAELDRKQWSLAAERISAGLLARRPARSGVAANGSEVGLLLREARKQRRFKPLRRLFAELPNLLPTLKPCLLMSPLSVAQHLGESAITFDLVVFDEASQILPADAIGAIARGKQVVVVGDRRQLPPTRFFQVATLEPSEEEADEEPPESVLDACLNAGLAECSLLWHYRSRHEHLIAFSNEAFYDGRLRTFPSPDADERVVTLEHVADGVYDRGGSRVNRVEAARVSDLIVEHAERQAPLQAAERQSLGVIAFSEAQMLAILTELETRKKARPELESLLSEHGEEGLFVKNLESVQGDERDVILLSVGYGRDAAGRLTMSFGPLNAPGGERRLNVAVTRARRRLTVVSSIHARDVDGRPDRPEGVRQLKRYLEYAEHGPAAVFGEAAQAMTDATSPFEGAVQAALAARGLSLAAGVGVGEHPVDLAVRDEAGRLLLALECDGETFGATPTARDRDRLRYEVLERLGWQVHRIWSTDWVANQHEEEQRVLAAMERARLIRDGLLVDEVPLAALKPEDRPAQGRPRADRDHSRPPSGPATRSQPPAPAGSVAAMQTAAPSLPPTEPATVAAPARPIGRVSRAEIGEAARTVLARDFAMQRDGLVVAVARELGYRRAGAKIKSAIVAAIDAELHSGHLTEVGGSVRLPDLKD